MLRDENRRLRAQLEASQRNVDDLNEVCGSQTALVNVAEARAKELQEQLEAQERMLTDVRRALSLDDMSRNDHEAGLTSEETLAFIREAVSSPAISPEALASTKSGCSSDATADPSSWAGVGDGEGKSTEESRGSRSGTPPSASSPATVRCPNCGQQYDPNEWHPCIPVPDSYPAKEHR